MDFKEFTSQKEQDICIGIKDILPGMSCLLYNFTLKFTLILQNAVRVKVGSYVRIVARCSKKLKDRKE